MSDIRIRPAEAGDDAALLALDTIAWDSSSGFPSFREKERETFFDERTTPDTIVVAELEGVVTGYSRLVPKSPIPENSHVLGIFGLAVDPAARGKGVGEALVRGTIERAREKGAHKLMLHVFSVNAGARRLYERCGFRVEAVLRDELRIDGEYIDDIIMAVFL